MEKEEAIEFILRELGTNQSQAEIVSKLSKELGAPQSVVEKFVSRVISDLPPAAPRSQPPAQQAPIHRQPSFAENHIQPDEPEVASPFIEQISSKKPVVAASRPYTSESPVQSVPPSTFDLPSSFSSQPPQLDEHIEKIILKGLTKHRRMDDIIMDVCQQGSLDWKQAQRLVAQVQAKNRKRLTSRRNAFLLPLAVVMIVAGLVLLWASGSEIQTTANALLNRDFSNPALNYMEDTVRIAPAYFITGLLLILGGGVGLFTALRSQLE